MAAVYTSYLNEIMTMLNDVQCHQPPPTQHKTTHLVVLLSLERLGGKEPSVLSVLVLLVRNSNL